MRGVLVFAPHADPTYTPLGLAALSAYVRENAPDCELVPLDLNLARWDRAAATDPAAAALRAALRAPGGGEAAVGASLRATWGRTAAQGRQLAALARAWLERDELAPDLAAFLRRGADLVQAAQPRWVGFSMLYPDQVLPTLALARFLTEEAWGGAPPGARPSIVLGGASAAALAPAEVLAACPFVDGIFAGEGEQGLVQLLRGAPPAAVAGLAWRDGDRIRINRKPDTLAAACVPLPDFAGLAPDRRWSPTPVLPVVFSRGCKWRRCRFCAHNLSYGGYRRQGADRFADHLGELQARWGASHFYFADQYVGAADLEDLSGAILARGLDLSFHVMGRPTGDYTRARLETMAAAGCRWISWGVETGSARLLQACGKGTTPAEIRRVLGDAHAAGIHNLMMMIFGLPTGTDADLQATFDLVADLGPAAGGVTSSCFQLFDRTPYAAQAARWGLRVTGREVLLQRAGAAVHSLRLFHQERADDGAWRPPRGSLEIAQWERFRRWTDAGGGLDGLSCEHMLIDAAHRGPARPRPRRAA